LSSHYPSIKLACESNDNRRLEDTKTILEESPGEVRIEKKLIKG
jgi:hypothetical protein